jgi:hypothetical protein
MPNAIYTSGLTPVAVALLATSAMRKHGGFTILHRPGGRYLVAHSWPSAILHDVHQDITRPILRLHTRSLDLNREGIGGWVDKETGLVYLDTVKTYKTKRAAVAFAEKEGQIAIYDSLKETAIYV